MNTPVVPASCQVAYRDNYEKGYAFEEFISKLFNERSFRVKQWLKAGKRPDHLPWADLTNPDPQMELVLPVPGSIGLRWSVSGAGSA